LLRDLGDCPPEALLQTIWQHQRLVRDRLVTLVGRPVRVLHPGFQSFSGGPDFRDAVVQFGDAEPSAGDVEVDLRSGGWRSHGHDRNPAFRRVILHVVWESEKAAQGTPATLCLSGNLDAPLGELSLWLGTESRPAFPSEYEGKCSIHLKDWPLDQLAELLRQAARARLEAKASQFRARGRQAGWEQALWEGAFRALGYRHNSWPMQRLGELRERWAAAEGDAFKFQARLLGLSGLLPSDFTRARTGEERYVRRLWDEWWRERDVFADAVLPASLWRFHGQRPANHPHRRLALAAHWAARADLCSRIERWCARDCAESGLVHTLWEELRVPSDRFWDWHWTLRSPRLKREQPLLGATRVTELAVNTVLPWLWARANEGRNYALQGRIERRFYAWPAGEDNAVLRQARLRLLGGLPPRAIPGAAAQQGLIQILRDFCDHSTSLCTACKLPVFVSSTGSGL
jgi:hypothetical protein